MAVFNETNKSKWTKDGRHWYFICYKKDSEGKNKPYKSKKFMTKKEAEEAERLFLLKRDNPAKKQFKIIAEAYFEDMYKTKKESTIITYESAYKVLILPYFEDLDISEIDINKVRQWKEELDKKDLALNYKNKTFNVLKQIFNFAVVNYGITNNPISIVGRFQENKSKIKKDEEKIRYITKEEFDKFISVIDKPLWKTFFIFLFYTGARRGEALALNWNDIDFNNDLITINKTLFSKVKGKVLITSTKNNINRKIKMSKILKEQLLEYKKEVMKYTDFSNNWFVFGNTRFLPLVQIDRYKDKYFEMSGVRRITTHEFRHSHVSLLINEYVKTSREKNIKIDTAKFFLMMSGRMGHTVDVMQRTYMHLFPTMQDELVDLLDNL